MNILGTEYEITQDNSTGNKDYDAICDLYSKRIEMRPVQDMLSPDDNNADKIKRRNEVMRHEIIHAFLFESGLEEQCYDEELVNWIAIQFPKLLRAFREVACTGE